MPSPLFIGPLGFLISALVVIVLVLVLLRVVFALAWRLIVIAAVVLGVLWLLGALGINTPGPTPF
ncbi:MAG: putative RND superfamily exporter protein [Natronomonas sp.]